MEPLVDVEENSAEVNIEYHLNQLSGEFATLGQMLRYRNQQVKQLKEQLDIQGRGFRSIRDELAAKTAQWETERRAFESQVALLKGYERRVFCFIDGDGTIFSRKLLVQGRQGGQFAARELAAQIQHYLADQQHAPCPLPMELCIYIFLHKKGLVDALGRAGYTTEKSNFDDFLAGFNQAGQRFIMVDVGAGKENADSKLKG